jgi:hypothetical protein
MRRQRRIIARRADAYRVQSSAFRTGVNEFVTRFAPCHHGCACRSKKRRRPHHRPLGDETRTRRVHLTPAHGPPRMRDKTSKACLGVKASRGAMRSATTLKLRCVGREGWRDRQAAKKSPARDVGRGYVQGPCRTLLVSRRSYRNGPRGRSPDLRISLLANAFPAVCRLVAYPVGVRPRLQWRVREGVAPSSRTDHLERNTSD